LTNPKFFERISNINKDLTRLIKKKVRARHQFLMPVILATQEAEIRKITV
jgi:hypothetical protein